MWKLGAAFLGIGVVASALGFVVLLPKTPRELSPEAMRALQRLFTPAGVAGGVLGGAAVN